MGWRWNEPQSAGDSKGGEACCVAAMLADYQCIRSFAPGEPVILPSKACSVGGCSGIVPCATHSGNRFRRTTKQRGYGGDWRALRDWKLLQDPICEMRTHCAGHVATEVDHKITIAAWPAGRLDPTNLQSACKSCHSAKTMAESVNALRSN